MMFRRSCILAALAAASTANGFTSLPRSSLASSTRRFVATEPKNDLFIDATATQSSVRDYYGKTLKESDDLATNACCAAAAPPQYIKDCIDNIHPTVKAKYYGCGLCLPQYDMTGLRVLDLGCGAGRDVS
jgi:arsenite methyltransferase